MERLEQAGYQQYEISNWARLDGQGNLRSCRHNLQYWRNLPYLGLGAGAHGFTGDYRTVNVLSPVDYIQRLSIGYGDTQWAIDGIDSHPGFPWTPATIEMNPIDIQTAMGETMMMGLRLVEEGVSESDFKLRFRRSLREVYAQEIQQLLGLGLIEWSGVAQDHLRLTPRGLLLGNQVFMHFV
jgi:oxygen-independent coproporphyrinogen-3 oxidase